MGAVVVEMVAVTGAVVVGGVVGVVVVVGVCRMNVGGDVETAEHVEERIEVGDDYE